jgi:hypothetical protein
VCHQCQCQYGILDPHELSIHSTLCLLSYIPLSSLELRFFSTKKSRLHEGKRRDSYVKSNLPVSQLHVLEVYEEKKQKSKKLLCFIP